jgi:hypothetical protein
MNQFWINTYPLFRLSHSLKLHRTVNQGEERIIVPSTDVQAGMDLCTMLADENRSGTNNFTAVPFHAQPLPLAITPITRTSNTFLMRHRSFILSTILVKQILSL